MTVPTSPPHDIAAEKSLIGSLLLAPEKIAEVANLIGPESLYVPLAADAFRCIKSLVAEGQPADPVSVYDRLRQQGVATDGADGWLVAAMYETPHCEHLAAYAGIVAEMYRRRQLIRVGGDLLEAGRNPAVKIDELIAQVADALERIPGAAVKPWGEIVAFDQDDLPEFPTDALPLVLRNWVQAVSIATQTPADMAALLGLAVISACIARHVDVQVTSDWREPVNLFVAVMLPPANRKSSVHAEALAPLRDVEREDAEAAAPVVAAAQSERRRLEQRLKRMERIAAEKGDQAAAAEADEIATQLAITPEVVGPRRIVDESTPEELAKILAAQGGRVASMSAEGGVFDAISMYSKSGLPNINVFLQAHAGDMIVIDRVSRPSLRVDRPSLTCAYAVQPAVIEALAANKVFRGRGLCARFAYASPRSWIGSRDVNPPPIPEDTRRAYHQLVVRLARLENEHVLHLSADAADDRVAWSSIVETMLAEGGELESIEDWGGKLVGLTVRIAAAMHCIEHGGPVGEIAQGTFQAAVRIGRYLIPHARHVLRRLAADDNQAADDGEYILRWIVRHGLRTFSRRDAHQHGKRRFPNAEDLSQGLAELVARNYIRPAKAENSGPGRPPSHRYEVNPAVFDGPEKRSQNSQNPAGGFRESNSGNCGSAFGSFKNANPAPAGEVAS